MSTWNKLPANILKAILEKLQNVQHCVAVCRDWQPHAQAVAYASIFVSDNDSLQDVQELIQAYKGSKKHLAHIVKTLHFNDCCFNGPLIVRYLGQFADVFPCVEDIICLFNKHLYEALIQTRDGGANWKCLKKIPEPSRDEKIRLYVTCCLMLCNSVTDILLADKIMVDDGDFYYKAQYDRLSNRLHRFSQLTTLKMIKYSNKSIEAFDPLIESCNENLKSLDWYIYNALKLEGSDAEYGLADGNESGLYEDYDSEEEEMIEMMKERKIIERIEKERIDMSNHCGGTFY